VPLSLLRLQVIAIFARFCTAGVVALVVLLCALAGAAATQGSLHPVPLWPRAGPTPGAKAVQVRFARLAIALAAQLTHRPQVASLSVVLLQAFTCQQCVHTLRGGLECYTLRRITRASAASCCLCGALYLDFMMSAVAAVVSCSHTKLPPVACSRIWPGHRCAGCAVCGWT